MSWSGKTLAGIILLIIGGSMVMGMVGIHVGGLVGLLLGLVLCYYGIKALKSGNKAIGVIGLIFGLMILTGSLPFLISLVLALICIYFGWKMIKKEEAGPNPVPAFSDDTYQAHDYVKAEDSFEDEWKRFLKRNNPDK